MYKEPRCGQNKNESQVHDNKLETLVAEKSKFAVKMIRNLDTAFVT